MNFRSAPALTKEHIAGARLFADTRAMIDALPIIQGGVIAEVGVMRGDTSLFMMKKFKPQKFVAFDLFKLHEEALVWGVPQAEFFDGLTQIEYFRRNTADFADIVVVEQGPSSETMPKYADHSFDLVFVDADHSYECVKSDAECAANMVKDSGILIFDDYIVYDFQSQVHYGVVPVVNDMVVNHGWSVVALVMHPKMFCQVAIQRDPKRSC